MEQKFLIFGKHGINKNAFHKHRHLTDINRVDIDKKVISSKVLYGKNVSFKYFIG